jgi:hypothetical protein
MIDGGYTGDGSSVAAASESDYCADYKIFILKFSKSEVRKLAFS